ncbi:MAG: IS1380 family transposase [Elusimicrobiota bacterium]
MLIKNLGKFKVSTTKQAVTSFAGLPLLLGMAKRLGLEEQLNALPIKKRERGYAPAESAFALMGLIQSGGIALDDVSLLRGDEGMRSLLGEMPAANTLGEWLRRFSRKTLCRLGKIQLRAAALVIRACGLKSAILDVDAFFVESQKSEVEMNYEGQWGYNPVAVTCAELKMPMAGLFRPGNASPMANLAGLLKRVMAELPGIEIRVRSDSAGYQAKVVRVLNAAGADFTITARKDDAVLETISEIPRKAWKRYESAAWPDRETDIAETLHVFTTEKDVPAHRLLVLRWPKEQRELFDKEPYEYHAVLTSLNAWPGGLVLQFHRNRQDGSENVNKELQGGFGLSKLPCRELMANAAYFQVALLANTVFAAMKHLALPMSWRPLTIKTVRFRLIRLAGLVQERARYLVLKIPERYPFLRLFEEARWAILSPPLAPVAT